MKEIIDCFNDRPLIELRRTRFLVNPLLDHHPETTPELLEDVIKELSKLVDLSKFDKVVCEEDRGGYIASILAYVHKKKLAMVKWNPHGLSGQHKIDFRNSYHKGKMYLCGIKKGDRVLLVEDLVDSGGTIISMIKLLRKAGADIIETICVAEKEDFGGVKRIKEETGIDVKSLVKFSCKSKKSKVTWARKF